jgi:hypothetical protein
LSEDTIPEFTGTSDEQARQAAQVLGDIREAYPAPPPEETDNQPPPVRRRIPGTDALSVEEASKALRRDRELDGEDREYRVTKEVIEHLRDSGSPQEALEIDQRQALLDAERRRAARLLELQGEHEQPREDVPRSQEPEVSQELLERHAEVERQRAEVEQRAQNVTIEEQKHAVRQLQGSAAQRIAQIEEIAQREFAPFIADPRNLQNINEAGVRRLHELNNAMQEAQRQASFAQAANVHLEQESLRTYYGDESAKFIKAHAAELKQLGGVEKAAEMARDYLKAPLEDGGLGLDDNGLVNLFRTRDAMSATAQALIFQAARSFHGRQSAKNLNAHRAPQPPVQRPSGRGMSSGGEDKLASLRAQLGKGSQKSQLAAAADMLKARRAQAATRGSSFV